MTGFILDKLTLAPYGNYNSLPSAASAAGMIVPINDGASGNCADGTCTTFGTHVTGGGGSLQLLLWSNGTNWTLIGK